MNGNTALAQSESGGLRSTWRPAWYASHHASMALIIALGVVSIMDAMIISSLLTPIKQEFAFSDEEIGRLAAAFTVAGLLGAPLFGFLANRWGRKRVLFAGIVVWSLASLASGLAGGLIGLGLWRALTGFGEAAYNSLAPGWLADLYAPRWRNLVFSLYMVKNKIGTALALALGGWLAASHGWRVAFFVAGVPGLILAALLYLGKEPEIGANDADANANGITRQGPFAVFRYPSYLAHLLASVFFFTAMSVQIWIPAFLHRAFAVSNQGASAFLAQTLMGTLPVGLIGGYFASLRLQKFRWGYPGFLGTTSIFAAAAFFAAYAATDLAQVKSCIVIGIALFGFSAGTLTTLVVELVPPALRNNAAATAAVVAGGVSGILGPELVGSISDACTLSSAIYVAPCGYLLAGIVWLLLALRLSFRAPPRNP